MILKKGINSPNPEGIWNDISLALDKIADKEVYFLDWPEPPTLEGLFEQIYRSRVDDRLYTFLIDGVSHLREFNEDMEDFQEKIQHLSEFATKQWLELYMTS